MTPAVVYIAGNLGYLGVALFVVLLVGGSWWWATVFVSACQSILERSGCLDRDSSPPSSLPGEGGHDGPEHHGPHSQPPSVGTLLHSPHPASFPSAKRERSK